MTLVSPNGNRQLLTIRHVDALPSSKVTVGATNKQRDKETASERNQEKENKRERERDAEREREREHCRLRSQGSE